MAELPPPRPRDGGGDLLFPARLRRRKLYDGGYGFGLYCTRAVEGGVQFVYVVSDVAETADGDLVEKRECWLYDTREDAPRRLDRLDGASIWGINPQGTHAIEGGGPPWRVVPLE